MSQEKETYKDSHQLPEDEQGNSLFPVFLKLEDMSLLIVGGGKVALEKLEKVILNSPATPIVLVAPDILPEIKTIADQHENVFLQEREFDPEDLDDVDIAIVAVDDKSISEFVVIEAHKRNLLVNVADTPGLCDFYLSSVVRKGDLKIAISTNGKSPALAKRLREVFEEALPGETQLSIEKLNELRTHLKGDFTEKVKVLNNATSILINKHDAKKRRRRIIRNSAIYALAGISLMILGHLLFSYITFESIGSVATGIFAEVDSTILLWIAGGLIAGFIDGALGMGYGVSATTFLMSFGISPAVASMSVHSSEIFTSGVSGLTHLRFGNVNTKLFRNILIPGVVGAILGAFLLVTFEGYSNFINPLVACYTFFLGVVIILKALKRDKVRKKIKRLFPLAFTGGFLDSIGGGGWGPIVSSTLISWGKTPRFIIGSVNLAEFFVALASSFTFITLIGLTHWQIIVGLIIGGAISSPIAATFAKKLNARTMMILVGIIVIIISIRNIIKVFL